MLVFLWNIMWTRKRAGPAPGTTRGSATRSSGTRPRRLRRTISTGFPTCRARGHCVTCAGGSCESADETRALAPADGARRSGWDAARRRLRIGRARRKPPGAGGAGPAAAGRPRRSRLDQLPAPPPCHRRRARAVRARRSGYGARSPSCPRSHGIRGHARHRGANLERSASDFATDCCKVSRGVCSGLRDAHEAADHDPAPAHRASAGWSSAHTACRGSGSLR